MRTRGLVKKLRVLAALTLLALLIQVGPGTAGAAGVTRWVNDDDPNGGTYTAPGTSCNNPGYSTIQDAVTAAAPGDTISVCPGTYSEQVVIPAGKNNLTLRSVTVWAAVIKAPPTIAADLVNSKAIVRVAGATNVSLLAFTISGPGPGLCDSLRYGVRVDSSGSANILGNHITEIRDTPFDGCQNGVAIQIGRQFEATTGRAVIIGNRLDGYQKNGLTVDNTGSYAKIEANLITGAGPTPIIAQNGIQISRGAMADVQYNQISDHAYTLPATTSTGILLYQAGRTLVDRNNLNRNQDGISINTMVGKATVSSNRITGNIPGFTSSTPYPAPFGDGIYAGPDTASNQIKDNYLRGNVEHDCHDDSVGTHNPPALVANFWTKNDGLTQNKPGLCRTGQGDGHHSNHYSAPEDAG
jgi:hypothetical protein